MTDFRHSVTLPLGIRNNNPGNLRYVSSIKWRGQVGSNSGFAVFDSVENGIRAMAIDLKGDIGKDGLNTITKLITSYAPPNENDTTAYINRVARDTGINANTKLGTDNNTLFKLIKAQIMVEVGLYAYMITDSMIYNGLNLMSASNNFTTTKNIAGIVILFLLLAGISYFILKYK